MTRIDDHFEVANGTQDRRYSAQCLIDVLDGGGGGGGGSGRTTMPATYWTDSIAPTVHITILSAANATTVLTARTTSGIQNIGNGYYRYDYPFGVATAFITVWDEGDLTDVAVEYIIVDL